jgi:predicted alpha-1,6-mannanase (GH76 family)
LRLATLWTIIKMVSGSFVGGLVGRAALLMSARAPDAADRATWTQHTVDGITALNKAWYSQNTGLWADGWWTSANCLTMLADFAKLDPAASTKLNIPTLIQNTYDKAQEVTVQTQKIRANAMVSSTNTLVHKRSVGARGFEDFLNEYYDDEGWWALALIHAHDLGVQGLGDQKYLSAAETIFEDMKAGNATCGGIWWSKERKYVSSISNELYLTVGAALANRIPAKKSYYLPIAQQQWQWFKNSGLINNDSLINDGLNDNCKNNGMKTWSYNQGVILGGLVELSKATSDAKLLDTATTIANAAITKLTRNGILYEGCEPDCGQDGAQFKGVFARNLRYLHAARPQSAYATFLQNNAESIWENDRVASNNTFGVTWPGPYTPAIHQAQCSALDALVGAVAVSAP